MGQAFRNHAFIGQGKFATPHTFVSIPKKARSYSVNSTGCELFHPYFPLFLKKFIKDQRRFLKFTETSGVFSVKKTFLCTNFGVRTLRCLLERNRYKIRGKQESNFPFHFLRAFPSSYLLPFPPNAKTLTKSFSFTRFL